MANSLHVLIVEDEPLIVDVVQATLELEYRVSSANTVGDALAILRTSHVDVVLVDNLPDGRGAEVAGVAESLGATVIEMSGYPEVMAELERSARPHLFKPFGAEGLLSTIAAVLQASGRGQMPERGMTK
jgi:DNA-binding NtrC family response regulator